MNSQIPKHETPYQHKILTIPNLLSFFRLALIPLMVWLYAIKGRYHWTTAILCLSGLTDVIDGWIARRYNMVSDFGKIIDPFADKLTLIAMLGCLATRFPAMIPLLVILAIKEVVNGVMGLAAIRRTGYVLSSEWHGKATTALLYLTIAVHLLWADIPTALSNWMLTICMAMMLFSAVLYFIRNGKMLWPRRKGGAHKETAHASN